MYLIKRLDANNPKIRVIFRNKDLVKLKGRYDLIYIDTIAGLAYTHFFWEALANESSNKRFNYNNLIQTHIVYSLENPTIRLQRPKITIHNMQIKEGKTLVI